MISNTSNLKQSFVLQYQSFMHTKPLQNNWENHDDNNLRDVIMIHSCKSYIAVFIRPTNEECSNIYTSLLSLSAVNVYAHV